MMARIPPNWSDGGDDELHHSLMCLVGNIFYFFGEENVQRVPTGKAGVNFVIVPNTQ